MYLKSQLSKINSVETTSIDVNQTNHLFSIGDVLRIDENSIYLKAQANNIENSNVIGIVSEVIDENNFILTTHGKIEGFTNLISGSVYFLSTINAGGITDEETDIIDTISKPILIAISETIGVFYNMRGTLLETSAGGTLHNELSNLDYENAGHTGFQKSLEWDEALKVYWIKN
jgi:hypothetical protein